MNSKSLSHDLLALKAVLLLRTVNRHESKEKQLSTYKKYFSDDELINYIKHFFDPQPQIIYEECVDITDDEMYRSSSARDYGPSNPWDAPGMSIHDFI